MRAESRIGAATHMPSRGCVHCSVLRYASALTMIVAATLLACCTCPRREGEIPEFRDQILHHLTQLQDARRDWLALLGARDVVEGVFHVNDRDEIQSKPEQWIHARLDAPRALLGKPQSEPKTFVVFNATIRRWGYWPTYSRQIQRANGQRCVVFFDGKLVDHSEEGKIAPIMLLSDLAPRRNQLESYLFLAKLDPVQVARLTANADPRIEKVVNDLRSATGDGDAVQSCYEDVRSLGTNALPGVLHAMMEILLQPESHHSLAINGVMDRPSGNRPGYPTLRVHDVFDVLSLSVIFDVDWGFPPGQNHEARWRLVRMTALTLLASEIPARQR